MQIRRARGRVLNSSAPRLAQTAMLLPRDLYRSPLALAPAPRPINLETGYLLPLVLLAVLAKRAVRWRKAARRVLSFFDVFDGTCEGLWMAAHYLKQPIHGIHSSQAPRVRRRSHEPSLRRRTRLFRCRGLPALRPPCLRPASSYRKPRRSSLRS